MRKSLRFAALGGIVLLSIPAFLCLGNIQETSAYSTSSLPTTIDLNDTTDSVIRNYYSSLNSKTESERQGTNLLKNLKTILKNGQKYYNYDSGNGVWQIYEIADRDWDKSPASSTTYGTYNASTKKISNYTYGTSASNSKNNPYIHALYINRDVNNQTTAWDNHNQDQWGINREHVWPKAEGFETSGAGGARGDPMHLMAGNGYANNIHSNYYYGYVKTSSSYTDCGTKYSNQSGNLRGTSKTLNSGTVFEPQDCDKGDIARAIFYMVARYNYLSGSDSDGIDSNNPNLTLTQSLSDWSSTGYSSTTSKTGKMGILTDLLAWHHADPVDQYEIHRNNLLYTNYTNNRNPFIDFPEWADYIWGTVVYNGSTKVSYDSNPTGYATPSSDTINGYNSGSTVSVTGVTLDQSSLSIEKGTSKTLTATVAPENATNKAVSWTSSNTNVATVSGGVVTGKNTGSATITVTTNDGNKTATCNVTVTAAQAKTLSSIEISDQKTQFEVGDTFTVGEGTVIATYSNGTTEDVTSSCSFSGYNLSTKGTQTVTVSYTYSGTTKTTTYEISVVESGGGSTSEESGSVTADTGKLEGWTLNGTGNYSDGSVKFDGTGDNVLNKSLFSGVVSNNMTSLTVTINCKNNPGSSGDSASNAYRVDAINSSGTVLATTTYTGLIGASYIDKVFLISDNLSGCTGIKITYATKSSGNWAIASVSWTAEYNAPVVDPTSITAELNFEKTFYVGEVISKDDITVTTNLDVDVTDSVSFSDYMFTYNDAVSGGAETNKTFPISYGDLNTNLTVKVQREAYNEIIEQEDEFTGAQFSSAGIASSYTTNQTAVINGYTLKVNGYVYTNSYSSRLSLSSSKTSAPGSVINQTPFPTGIIDVEITGATPDIQLSTNGSTWVDLSSATVSTTNYYYFKVFFKNTTRTNYVNISKIDVTRKGSETANNVANYIMYEDTEGQCETKFDIASGYFNTMSSAEKSKLINATSDQYVLFQAKDRFEKWAIHEGKSIVFENGDYTIKSIKPISLLNNDENSNNITVLLIISFASIGSLSIYVFLRKKRAR